MLFNSFEFLIFFPVVFLLYYCLPARYQRYLLLAASLYFYMCWKPEFVLLLLFSAVFNYAVGIAAEKRRAANKSTAALKFAAVAVNLLPLVFFKYLNFFGETLSAVLHAFSIPFSAPVLKILLPVGISFYTFQAIGYVIDVSKGKLAAERSFINFALFISFFPQLLSGPIGKAGLLLPQLTSPHKFNYSRAAAGIKLMVWGFFKKLVIAAYLGKLVDPVYNSVRDFSGGAVLIATIAFAIQIYCDFSGYSDIARGCAMMLDVDLIDNFKAPYLACSVSDFWRRWHISLTSWFREYVYIPLGGNRKGKAKKCLFVLITFFLSGLWHGAAWTFIVWGVLNAVLLNLESLFFKKSSKPLSAPARTLGRLYTFIAVSFTWIFFRADSLSDSGYVISHLFTGLSNPLSYFGAAWQWLSQYSKAILACIVFSIILLTVFDIFNSKRSAIEAVSSLPAYVRWPIYIIFITALALLIPREAAAPFIYFQF